MDVLYNLFDRIAYICNIPYTRTSFSYIPCKSFKKDIYISNLDLLNNFLRLWMECKKHGLSLHIHTVNHIPMIGWYKLAFMHSDHVSIDIYAIQRDLFDNRWYIVNETARDLCSKKYLLDSEFVVYS